MNAFKSAAICVLYTWAIAMWFVAFGYACMLVTSASNFGVGLGITVFGALFWGAWYFAIHPVVRFLLGRENA